MGVAERLTTVDRGHTELIGPSQTEKTAQFTLLPQIRAGRRGRNKVRYKSCKMLIVNSLGSANSRLCMPQTPVSRTVRRIADWGDHSENRVARRRRQAIGRISRRTGSEPTTLKAAMIGLRIPKFLDGLATRGFRVAAACTGWLALTLVGCSYDADVEQTAESTVATADDEFASPPDAETLRREIDEALDFTLARHMNTQDHAAWQIVHGILAYGRDLKIVAEGQTVSALDHALTGGYLRGWNMRPGDKGLESILESGSKEGQGHEDQWLGYLSQVGLPVSQPISVRGQTYTLQDLIRQAEWDVYDGMEATWTLMAFSTYLPLEHHWTSKDGSHWNMERLVAMEAAQPLQESSCGGAHRLYGLTCAVNRFAREGKPLTGGWKAADDRIQESIRAAKAYQQADGALSTDWFFGAAASPEIALRISSTGHVLEFLVLAMTDAEVREPWVAKAAWRLCDMLRQTRELPVECGALYHAAHGLYLYRLRLYGEPWRPYAADPPAPTDTPPAAATAATIGEPAAPAAGDARDAEAGSP